MHFYPIHLDEARHVVCCLDYHRLGAIFCKGVVIDYSLLNILLLPDGRRNLVRASIHLLPLLASFAPLQLKVPGILFRYSKQTHNGCHLSKSHR